MGSLTPFVFWGQNKSKVFMKVDLKDVKTPTVNLSEDNLDFSAHGVGVRGKNDYKLNIDFYLPIDTEKSQYRVTDRHIEFQLFKVGQGESWPRLTENQLRPPWLKIDFDHFAFEDEDSSDNDELNDMKAMDEEEMMRRLEKDLLDERGNLPAIFNLRKTYLVLYNMFQWVGYTFVFTNLLLRYFVHETVEDAFESVGSQLMLLQLLSVLEVIHSLVGIVHSPAIMPLMQPCNHCSSSALSVCCVSQVIGRNLVLFGLIFSEPHLYTHKVVWCLFTTWSAVEVFRYPFYILSTLSMEWKWVTWIRYTAWIPLYPLGFLFEGMVMLVALPYFEKSEKFSIELPNATNFSFSFPVFLRIYMCLFLVGGYLLMNKMYETRKKKLGIKTPLPSKLKKKSS